MSRLALLSGSLDEKIKSLETVNEALIITKAVMFGLGSTLKLEQNKEKWAKDVLVSFCKSVLEDLEANEGKSKYGFIYPILKKGKKPISDWKEDMADLIDQAKNNIDLTERQVRLIEELLSFVDKNISSKVHQLI